MSVRWSKPTMLPCPTMQPSAASASKSNAVSSFHDGRIPPSGPPIWTALMPPPMPPARPSQSSLRGTPKRTSYTPGEAKRSLKQTSLEPAEAPGLRSR